MALNELIDQIKIANGIPDLALIAINAYAGYQEASGNPLPKDVAEAIIVTTLAAAGTKGSISNISKYPASSQITVDEAISGTRGWLQGGLLIAPADILIGKLIGYAAYAITRYA